MTCTLKRIAAALFSAAMAGNAMAAGEADSLRTAPEDGKASGKGLTFYVGGSAIPGVVVSVNDKYAVAKSQAQGTIVIKLEKIDAVAAFGITHSGKRGKIALYAAGGLSCGRVCAIGSGNGLPEPPALEGFPIRAFAGIFQH